VVSEYNYLNAKIGEGHMEINVSQQLKENIGTVREYEVSDSTDIVGIGASSPVAGSVKLTRTNRGILVQGTLQTRIPVECSRCLKVFDYPLTLNIEEEYFPVIDVNSGTPIEIPDDVDGFTIDEHHILDLSEAIRQNALLAIPMKVLCRKDCAGICQDCGKSLNEGPCDCDTEKIDPRWAKLAKLASAGKNSKKRKKETE
jgi:uncharacterized protein